MPWRSAIRRSGSDSRQGGSPTNTQLEAVSKASCERYPGIEINYLESIARTNPSYIRESLSAVREFGFEGVALCWNVMEAPDEHIECIEA